MSVDVALTRMSSCPHRNQGATVSMSGYRAQPACIALMLAAMSPLLAGCEEPTAATATTAAQAVEPDVSIVVVQPRARSMVRELPGRVAPTRVSEVRPRVSGIVV